MQNLDYKKMFGEKITSIPSHGKGGSEMLNYSFKPDPIFVEKKGCPAKTFFGIELEYACKNEDMSEDYNLFDFVEGVYRQNDFEKLFYTKHDSSFYGPEFVFQPISFLGMIELYKNGFWKTFFEMKDKFYKSTYDTGFHIHLDKDKGTTKDNRGVRANQNMLKIAYSINWLYENNLGVFKNITKRKNFEYCTPRKTVTRDDHSAAINETAHTYEIRFWGSPVTLERFMYCVAVTEAIDIVSKNYKVVKKEEILRLIFFDIPKKIEKVCRIKLLFPKRVGEMFDIPKVEEECMTPEVVLPVIEPPEMLSDNQANEPCCPTTQAPVREMPHGISEWDRICSTAMRNESRRIQPPNIPTFYNWSTTERGEI